MAIDVFAVQNGLATAAATIAGLRTSATLPDSISPPFFAPLELDLSYDQSFGGLVEVVFTCQLLVSRGDTPVGRKALLGYLAPVGAGSIKRALEADRTLAGVAGTLIVERVRGAGRIYTVGAIEYLGAQLDVKVWA